MLEFPKLMHFVCSFDVCLSLGRRLNSFLGLPLNDRTVLLLAPSDLIK